MSRRHSGFNVFCGPRIQLGEQEAMENLARYIIRAYYGYYSNVLRGKRKKSDQDELTHSILEPAG